MRRVFTGLIAALLLAASLAFAGTVPLGGPLQYTLHAGDSITITSGSGGTTYVTALADNKALFNQAAIGSAGVQTYGPYSHDANFTMTAVTVAASFSITRPNALQAQGGTVNVPAPTVSALGGLFALSAATSHQWVAYIDNTGTQQTSQPACGDLSNAAASCSTDATNASNLSSGTVPAARLPTPGASTLGAIESASSVSHEWVSYIDTSGVQHQSQPGFGDLSGSASAAQMPAFTGDATTSAGSTATTVAKVNGNTPGGACTNQVVTSIDSSGRPTCATVTSTKVDTSVATTGADLNTSSQVTVTHLAAGLPVNQGGLGQNSASASGQVPKATSTTASAWTSPSLGTFNTVVAGPLTSNDTSEGTSNTTLTADSNFTVTVPSVGRYQFTLFLMVSEATSGAGGFKSDNSTGSATIGDIEAMFFYYCTSGTSGQLPVAGTSGAATAGSCSTVNTSTTAPTGFITTGQINFTGTGTFGLRWAQNSSSANTTSIQAGSYLMLTRIE